MTKFLFSVVLSVALFFSVQAGAVNLAWDHPDTSSVKGYAINYAPTDGSSGPYVIIVSEGSTLTVNIPESHFEPGVEYTIYATAYAEVDPGSYLYSDSSNEITYTRHGWGPPVDVPPIKLWLKPGNPNNLNKQ